MRAVESSSVGSSIHPIMSFGAPAHTAALSTIRAASQVDRRARGCGLNTMPLRVLSAINALKMAVDVGFVVGTMPQITPIGSATVIEPASSSSLRTPQVFSSLYLLKMYSDAKWFLMTLSSTTPMPVSSTAICASGIR